MTFVVGLLGIATVYPIGRLSFGPWVGPSALALCLLTGYLYGNLFFAPIDIPFLANMCWALLGIMVMARSTFLDSATANEIITQTEKALLAQTERKAPERTAIGKFSG